MQQALRFLCHLYGSQDLDCHSIAEKFHYMHVTLQILKFSKEDVECIRKVLAAEPYFTLEMWSSRDQKMDTSAEYQTRNR